MMALTTTKPFVTSPSQAVRIPRECCFAGDEELVINRVDGSVIITPKSSLAPTFFSGASLLDDDFMVDGRPDEIPTVREAFE